MTKVVGEIGIELRHTIAGRHIQPPLAHSERLVRAYAAYFVCALDVEEHVWGSATMCFVALGMFGEALDALAATKKGGALPSDGLTDVIEGSIVDAELQVDMPGEE